MPEPSNAARVRSRSSTLLHISASSGLTSSWNAASADFMNAGASSAVTGRISMRAVCLGARWGRRFRRYSVRMRRRLRSAAVPLHRHSLLQLAIDGALVAAAYYLSFRLRFDAGVPEKYDRLFEATIAWVVVTALVVFTLLRLEVKQWRYTGHRDYPGVV